MKWTKRKDILRAIIKQEGGKLFAVASDESVDRQGDKLDMSKWDLTNFKKNPVLLAGHMYAPQFVIGKVAGLKVEGKKLLFNPEFHEITELAREMKRMVEEGWINAFSVGFQWKRKIDETGKVVDEVYELLEISLVAVPANANALVRRSAASEDEVKALRKWFEESADVDLSTAFKGFEDIQPVKIADAPTKEVRQPSTEGEKGRGARKVSRGRAARKGPVVLEKRDAREMIKMLTAAMAKSNRGA
jgi:HK97 family phage prohead protease